MIITGMIAKNERQNTTFAERGSTSLT